MEFGGPKAHMKQGRFMSEVRIWYSRGSEQEKLPSEFQNEIVLSPAFQTGVSSEKGAVDNAFKIATQFIGGCSQSDRHLPRQTRLVGM